VFKVKIEHAFLSSNQNMSKENLQRFCRLVLSDSEIQNQLKNLLDRDEFIKKLVELGAHAGFEISPADIEQQLRENRKLWNEKWI
jgi:predicted ribosomally synthesized peptide with nif11-like leader